MKEADGIFELVELFAPFLFISLLTLYIGMRETGSMSLIFVGLVGHFLILPISFILFFPVLGVKKHIPKLGIIGLFLLVSSVFLC